MVFLSPLLFHPILLATQCVLIRLFLRLCPLYTGFLGLLSATPPRVHRPVPFLSEHACVTCLRDRFNFTAEFNKSQPKGHCMFFDTNEESQVLKRNEWGSMSQYERCGSVRVKRHSGWSSPLKIHTNFKNVKCLLLRLFVCFYLHPSVHSLTQQWGYGRRYREVWLSAPHKVYETWLYMTSPDVTTSCTF
jgi:hypothetical protein